MVWLLNGTGGPAGPPPRVVMLVLNLLVVWLTPLLVLVIWSPNMKTVLADLPIIWASTVTPTFSGSPRAGEFRLATPKAASNMLRDGLANVFLPGARSVTLLRFRARRRNRSRSLTAYKLSFFGTRNGPAVTSVGRAASPC